MHRCEICNAIAFHMYVHLGDVHRKHPYCTEHFNEFVLCVAEDIKRVEGK